MRPCSAHSENRGPPALDAPDDPLAAPQKEDDPAPAPASQTEGAGADVSDPFLAPTHAHLTFAQTRDSCR
jgi:hypothetical protein